MNKLLENLKLKSKNDEDTKKPEMDHTTQPEPVSECRMPTGQKEKTKELFNERITSQKKAMKNDKVPDQFMSSDDERSQDPAPAGAPHQDKTLSSACKMAGDQKERCEELFNSRIKNQQEMMKKDDIPDQFTTSTHSDTSKTQKTDDFKRELMGMNYGEIEAFCRKLGVSTDGTKDDLMTRIMNNLHV